MSVIVRWSAALALAVCLYPAAVAAEELHARSVKLRYEPQYILEAVARQMNVALRPEVPLPAVHLASTTPVRRFQAAMAAQWGFRPRVFANAYAVAHNEIYLMDDAAYYGRHNRTLDASLAHEFAHYIQVHYLNADLRDPSWENDAIAAQQRFAEDHPAPMLAAAR